MTTTELDNIKDKIQKLLAKADSAKEIGNIAEAAAFSAKVNELLMKYNLEKIDIEFGEDDPIIENKENGLVVSKKMGRWTSKLLGVICHYNFCKDIFTSYGREKEMSVTIIGKKENVEVVIFLYEILKGQLETVAKKAWKAYMVETKEALANHPVAMLHPEVLSKPWKYIKSVSNRAAYYKSFFLGAVLGIHEKLEAEMTKAEETYGDKVGALVRVTDAQLTRFVDENYSNLGNFGNRKTKVNGAAYEQGKEAGLNASMARGVATGDSIATKHLA